jgi:carboxyl-terminal processing protease
MDYKYSEKKPGQRFVKILFVLLIFAIGYIVGILGGTSDSSGLTKVIREKFSNSEYKSGTVVLNKVLSEIDKSFVNQPVDQQKLFYGALQGMVSSLGDPYSSFLDPENTDEFREIVEGSFEGIGAEIGVRDERIVIIAPLKDSPAESSGARPGDVIVTIDGELTDGLTLDEAVQRLRGEKGTQVAVEVIHEDGDSLDRLDITRDTIKLTSVNSEIITKDNKSIGLIEISNFTSSTADEFSAAVNELVLSSPSGYIIDLRNNPGGFLDSAIEIIGHFVGDDVALIEEFNDGKKEEHRSAGNGELGGATVVVLVNQGSASAAEIVAGALQDYELARLIGTKTFGKGSVQNYEQLSDGSSLKLTVAKWLTPKGRSIDGNGIEPDEIVGYTEEDLKNGLDPQLDRAQEYIIDQCCSG